MKNDSCPFWRRRSNLLFLGVPSLPDTELSCNVNCHLRVRNVRLSSVMQLGYTRRNLPVVRYPTKIGLKASVKLGPVELQRFVSISCCEDSGKSSTSLDPHQIPTRRLSTIIRGLLDETRQTLPGRSVLQLLRETPFPVDTLSLDTDTADGGCTHAGR